MKEVMRTVRLKNQISICGDSEQAIASVLADKGYSSSLGLNELTEREFGLF